jgi:hypothetical protein
MRIRTARADEEPAVAALLALALAEDLRESLALLPGLTSSFGWRRVPGVIRAVIEAALERIADERIGVYLEVCAGGPHALHRKFGFERHGTVEPGFGAPVMETMWRGGTVG